MENGLRKQYQIPILETERLLLLPWKPEYAESMLLFAANKNVADARGLPLVKSIKGAKAKINTCIINNIDDWAIALKTDNGSKIIGSIGIHKHAKNWRFFNKFKLSFNLVYMLAEEYWGQGICTEAAKKVMHYAFIGIRCDALGANHMNWNNRSRRVIEKCKFNKIDAKFNKDKPSSIYYMTKEDYFKLYNESEQNMEYGVIDISKYEPKVKNKTPQKQPTKVKGSPYSVDNPIRKINAINLAQASAINLSGYACVAMLADVSLDAVIKIAGKTNAIGKKEIETLSRYYGFQIIKLKEDITNKNDLRIIRVGINNIGEPWYWAIYFNGVCYDPVKNASYDYTVNKNDGWNIN